MDDEFELLGRQDPEDGTRRPWALVGGILAVALLTLVGVGWMVNAMLDGGTRVQPAAAAPTSAAGPTSPPVPTPSPTPSVTESAIPTVPSPTPSVPLPTVTVPSVPARSATVVPPRPTPVRTTPRVTPRPVPVPTVTRVPIPVPPVPGRLVVVPDVVGQRVKGAVVTLQAAGFRVTILGGAFVAPPGDRDDRRVSAQRPGGGGLAPRGSMVVLITDGL